MKFTIRQVFEGDAQMLCAALTDGGYLATMGALPDLGSPELVAQKKSRKGVVTQQLQTKFTGKLPSVALKVIDPEKLVWDEFSVVDTKAFSATFEMVPTHYQNYFRCSGSWRLEADGSGTSTTRIIDGELKVSSPIPFVNGQVERAIVSGLKGRLSKEPANYKAWLNSLS
jgi:Protein of unknown function (DUF2505)